MKRVLFAVLVLMLASLACGPQFVTPCESCVKMVQPNGWQAGRDSQYAGGVNLPNSQANENNAQAQYYQAQAEQMKAETIMTNLGGRSFFGVVALFVLGFIGVIALFVLGALFLRYLEWRREGEPVQVAPPPQSTVIKQWTHPYRGGK